MAANIGKTVTLFLNVAESTSGTIESVHNHGNGGGYQIMLKGQTAYRLVSSDQISGFELGERAVERLVSQSTEIKKFLNIRLENPKPNTTIELTYLTDKLSWVPQYQAQLIGNQRIQLQLFATILNDRASLNNIRLNLAVGQPEFLFSRMNDPLFDRSTVREFLAQLNNGGSRVETSPMMMQNVITSQRASVMTQNSIPTTTNALNEADLYFFNIHNFSLDKGHTAKVRLLELEAEYTDVYTCNLNSRNGAGNTFRVNHAIKFRNTSPHPLTTGIIMFHRHDDENGFEPLGQQQLDFIAPGTTGQIRLGIATGVIVDQLELVGEPIKDEARDRYYRDRTVTFQLTNTKNKPITLRLRRTVNGYLLQSEIDPVNISDGLANRSTSYNQYDDRSNNYEWVIDLAAGENREVQVEFRTWQ